VCGVDGSAGAAEALAAGADLASALGSELVAVHVEEPPIPMASAAGGIPAWPGTARDSMRRAAREVVERAVEDLDTEAPVRMRCETGDPAERLGAVASEPLSAILVVGSRGHGPLRSALLGSVSARLCASAPVPVVVVPHGASLAGLGLHRAGAAPARA
jgi:nucleotide-binding universal stress UspA family protein